VIIFCIALCCGLRGKHGFWPKKWWKIVCVAESVIFGIPGAILTALSTTDPDANISVWKATVMGVTYTALGIIFASVAG
jgi:hypothetical protein